MITTDQINALLSELEVGLRDRTEAPTPMLNAAVVDAPEEDLWIVGVEQLRSEDPRRRILGTRLIRELKSKESKVAMELTALLDEERIDGVIYWIVAAFGFVNSELVTDKLLVLARHPDPGIRYYVAGALSNRTDMPPLVAEALVGLASDANEEVRFSAVFELGTWWHVNHLAKFESTLRNALEDVDKSVREAARRALDEPVE